MSLTQGQFVQMAKSRLPNQESQELTRLIVQKKKTLIIPSYGGLKDESVKSVLNTFPGYEPSHESSTFYINDARDVAATLISVTAAIQDPKCHMSPSEPVRW